MSVRFRSTFSTKAANTPVPHSTFCEGEKHEGQHPVSFVHQRLTRVLKQPVLNEMKQKKERDDYSLK